MKNIKYLAILALALFVAACSNDYDVEEYFDLEELPGYIAFFADGNSTQVPVREISEEGGATSVIVHSPTEIISDVTVTYTIGGTAVFGEDYTIEGADANGGTMTVSADRGNFGETYRGSIDVVAIDDDTFEGDKTVVLTITGASNAEGEIAIGRGGLDLQKVATVNILDDECFSSYEGSYRVITTATMIREDGMLIDTMLSYDTLTTMVTQISEFVYTVNNVDGGFYDEYYGLDGIDAVEITEDCGGIVAPDFIDSKGDTLTITGSGVVDTEISLSLENISTGEMFTSLFTQM